MSSWWERLPKPQSPREASDKRETTGSEEVHGQEPGSRRVLQAQPLRMPSPGSPSPAAGRLAGDERHTSTLQKAARAFSVLGCPGSAQARPAGPPARPPLRLRGSIQTRGANSPASCGCGQRLKTGHCRLLRPLLVEEGGGATFSQRDEGRSRQRRLGPSVPEPPSQPRPALPTCAGGGP